MAAAPAFALWVLSGFALFALQIRQEGRWTTVAHDDRSAVQVAADAGATMERPGEIQDAVAAAIAAARTGGTNIVCRHAVTASFPEVEPLDYADHSSQRRLSDEGRRQSAELGRAFRTLGVEVSELVASPMHRARETAELMFRQPIAIDSIWHTNDGNYEGANRDRRIRVLATSVPSGNRLIVSHIGTMTSVLPRARSRADEGDCVVVRPSAGNVDGVGRFEVVGVVPWRAWISAARDRGGPNSASPTLSYAPSGSAGCAHHSPLSACTGSTRAARRAGT